MSDLVITLRIVALLDNQLAFCHVCIHVLLGEWHEVRRNEVIVSCLSHARHSKLLPKNDTVEGAANSFITPDNGQVVIMGLAEGTYQLKEITAPDGYNKLNAPVTVEISKNNAVELSGGYVVNNGEMNGEALGVLTIENNSGVELPSTGGQGTMLMITIGTMMAIAFAVLLITQKKMSVYHD